MLQTNLQMYQNVAHQARLGELQPDTIDAFMGHLGQLKIERECAEDLGRDDRAEFAKRALQTLARGLADLHSISALRLHDFAEEAAEEEMEDWTREEKINELQKIEEFRLDIAFKQPTQN